MPDECGWQPVTPGVNNWSKPSAAGQSWRPQPYVLMLEDGGFLELDDCGLLSLEG